MMTNRKWGRGAADDGRDRNYAMNGLPRRGMTRRYWSRQWLGDQAESSHCVGYAFAHWMTTPPVVRWLDPVGVYNFAKHVDEWQGESYEGTSVRAGAKVLQKLGLIAEYRWAWDVEFVADALLELGPVVVGTSWFAGMMIPNSDNVIFPSEAKLGGHAYLLDGVDIEKRLFRLTNSWGKDWGHNGRAVISFSDFEVLLADGGEACILFEANPPH